ncbi:Transcriptional regulator, contains XRE-family HTH domain [Rhodoblastus acidophilus]|uniref:Transcriptional regulator, contains XRE-family HTH domain n=1 Tax=Rhodoblastus acidophilus TaxID=1074 RepID=A0A212PZZ5_RHOAC|nr:helix-turn-helix domain-containing protein [Rhodoblastus acidophilus]PPQ36627.1 helix-turn-helix domain-containing protein [Rhodoblastus acidophilus]RAI20466.1 helix-turn-helix domain-containing protein [Rhodoblastus acidophilus]SNB52613.1 Transcriptional regulator, contains XRE-family HTH domain [Rhodoblastus acidophilus]
MCSWRTTARDAAIGARIRTRRERLAITVQELAEYAGVSPAAVRLYEEGLTPVPPEQLLKVSKRLSVMPGYFFDLPLRSAPKPKQRVRVTRAASPSELIEIGNMFLSVSDGQKRRFMLRFLQRVAQDEAKHGFGACSDA